MQMVVLDLMYGSKAHCYRLTYWLRMLADQRPVVQRLSLTDVYDREALVVGCISILGHRHQQWLYPLHFGPIAFSRNPRRYSSRPKQAVPGTRSVNLPAYDSFSCTKKLTLTLICLRA